MKLIGTTTSPFLMRVLFCARLKGIDVQLEAPEDDTHGPAFRKLNPLGKVPVLVDGDFVLPESLAICEYMEEKFDGPSIWPDGMAGRAQARMLHQIIDLYLAPDMFNCLLPDMAPGPAQGAKGRLFGWMDAIEVYLRLENLWLTGRRPTLVDASMATTLFYFDTLGVRYGAAAWIDARPLLSAWWKRTKHDPMFIRIFNEQMDGLSQDLLA